MDDDYPGPLCSGEVQGMSDVWSSCFGRLTSSFLQLANDLHDFNNVIDARIAKIQIQTQQGLDGFNKIMTDFFTISGQDPSIGHPALIAHRFSTNASETGGLPRTGCHCRRDCPVAYEAGNILHLHSRPRWNWKDFSCTGRCRPPSYQGTVST